MRAETIPTNSRSAPRVRSVVALADAGWVEVVPLLRSLLRLSEARWQGSLALLDGQGQWLGALCFDAGQISAGSIAGARDWVEGLQALCARHDVSLEPTDEDVEAPASAEAAVDLVQLAVAVMRGPVQHHLLHDALMQLADRALELSPHVDLERYRWLNHERNAIACLSPGPVTLHELGQRTGLSELALQRIVYTLWITQGLVVSDEPSTVRSQPVPILSTLNARRRDDEPTVVAARFDAQLHDREAETSASNETADTVRAYPSRPPAPRTRASAPATPAVSAGCYRVQRPDNGLEVTGHAAVSGRPPASARPAATVSGSARFDADAHFATAERLLKLGYVREAVFQAQIAMRLSPPRPEQLALYAWLIHSRDGGSHVSARVREYLERALSEDPNCTRAHYFKGLIFSKG